VLGFAASPELPLAAWRHFDFKLFRHSCPPPIT
jgi:hypothetical protein